MLSTLVDYIVVADHEQREPREIHRAVARKNPKQKKIRTRIVEVLQYARQCRNTSCQCVKAFLYLCTTFAAPSPSFIEKSGMGIYEVLAKSAAQAKPDTYESPYACSAVKLYLSAPSVKLAPLGSGGSPFFA